MGPSSTPHRILDLLLLIDCHALRKACQRVPPEIWRLEPDQLEKAAKPASADRMIRFNLWKALSEDVLHKRMIKGKEIYQGACSYTHFWYGILKNPAKVVWILEPVNAYNTQVNQVFSIAFDEMIKTLQKPTDKKNGGIDHKLLKRKFDIFKVFAEHPAIRNQDTKER